jgi:hypothetical protein
MVKSGKDQMFPRDLLVPVLYRNTTGSQILHENSIIHCSKSLDNDLAQSRWNCNESLIVIPMNDFKEYYDWFFPPILKSDRWSFSKCQFLFKNERKFLHDITTLACGCWITSERNLFSTRAFVQLNIGRFEHWYSNFPERSSSHWNCQ